MIPLVYVLRGDEPRQPERNALAALDALRDEFEPLVFVADDRGREAADEYGLPSLRYDGHGGLLRSFRRMLAESGEITFVASCSRQAFLMMTLNMFYRRRLNQIHIVAGDGGDADLDRSSTLRKYDVKFVAGSETIRSALIARGVGRDRVNLLEPFMTPDGRVAASRRKPFRAAGVRRVAVFGTAAEVEDFVGHRAATPAFENFDLTICVADGAAGAETNASTTIASPAEFAANIADFDLLLSLSPWESAGNQVLNALAAGVPVLLAAADEYSSVISNGVNGFVFRHGDAAQLTAKLAELARMSADRLNAIAKGGEYLLKIRFSAEKGIERYRQLFVKRQLPPVELNGGKLIL